jgi:hypothetical protein
MANIRLKIVKVTKRMRSGLSMIKKSPFLRFLSIAPDGVG